MQIKVYELFDITFSVLGSKLNINGHSQPGC